MTEEELELIDRLKKRISIYNSEGRSFMVISIKNLLTIITALEEKSK